jgi:hypothetical protein
VPSQLLTQCPVLLSKRLVAIPLAALPYSLHRPA